MAAPINVGKFVGSIVAITVAVIVVAVVAVPIIAANNVGSGVQNHETINTILNIIPVFLVIAILIGAIGMFVKSRQ